MPPSPPLAASIALDDGCGGSAQLVLLLRTAHARAGVGGGLTLRQIDVALERCEISVPPIPAATVPPTTTTAPPTTRVSYDHFGLGAGALEPLNPENQESGAAGGARVVWAWALGAVGLVVVWGEALARRESCLR